MKIEIHKRFISGFLTCWALTSLQQDYWGMEGTVRHVVNDWVSWKITVPLAIAVLLLARFLSYEAENEER